jgi:hypothetical protein
MSEQLGEMALTLLLALIGAGEASAAETPAENLLAKLNREGPSHVFERLEYDVELREQIGRKIATAQSDWLAFAAQIYTVSAKKDHEFSVQLADAVALALPRAPARVLPLIQAGIFPVHRICGDIDEHLTAEFGQTSNFFYQHLLLVERAVSLFQTHKYSAARDECLREVRDAIFARKVQRQMLRDRR